MKYWFSILIILLFVFSAIELRAEVPDYDEMIEKLES